jgi:hypothetical protein
VFISEPPPAYRRRLTRWFMSQAGLNVAGYSMASRTRLPGGEPRKASQRRTRRGEPLPTRIAPQWRVGDRVRWGGQLGSFGRNLDDGTHAEIRIGHRLYRVRISIGYGSPISDRGDGPCQKRLSGAGSTRDGEKLSRISWPSAAWRFPMRRYGAGF